MLSSRRLILAHFWFAFAGFGAALLLGEWQMFIRSPLHTWIGDPELYYRSVTAHGTTMAYVMPTLVAMGYGYFVTEASLKRPLIGLHWAWLGLALVFVGTIMAIVPVALGLASVPRWCWANGRCSSVARCTPGSAIPNCTIAR